jgi:hypothetical protein
MSRHAQEYWLKRQAEKAVKVAMGGHFITEMKDRFGTTENLSKDVAVLNELLQLSIWQAAKNLTLAELYHRAILEQGGTLEEPDAS